MTAKLLDIEYLRSQWSNNGNVLVTTSGNRVTSASNIAIINGKVGIGTGSPAHPLTVVGNVAIVGSSSGIVFQDGSRQVTAATPVMPGGNVGEVQFSTGTTFSGSSNLFWDQGAGRLGIGTNSPRSTLQLIDVGYESTNTSTSDISPVVLDSFPVPDYRSCHYIVQITDNSYSLFHTTQIMLIHDGMNAFKSEYNIVATGDRLGEITCRVQLGMVELVFEAFYSSNKNIKVIRTSIEP